MSAIFENDDQNIAQTAADLATKAMTGKAIETEPEHFIIVPEGFRVESLAKYQFSNRPQRRTGNIEMFDAASFIQYYTDFADANSRIFADPDKARFVAILDYHEMGDSGQARFGQHRVSFTCKFSREWAAWAPSNNRQMTQEEFAIWLEDNGPDIFQPTADAPSQGVMIDVARSLKAKKNVDFSSDINLANGQIQFHYSEQISGRTTGGDIEVPEAFYIKAPVYHNGPPHTIKAFLRWRIGADKKLVFWFTLNGVKKLTADAFNEIRLEIQDGTQDTVLLGDVR